MRKLLFGGFCCAVLAASTGLSLHHARAATHAPVFSPQVQEWVQYPNGQTCIVTNKGVIVECWRTGQQPP